MYAVRRWNKWKVGSSLVNGTEECRWCKIAGRVLVKSGLTAKPLSCLVPFPSLTSMKFISHFHMSHTHLRQTHFLPSVDRVMAQWFRFSKCLSQTISTFRLESQRDLREASLLRLPYECFIFPHSIVSFKVSADSQQNAHCNQYRNSDS